MSKPQAGAWALILGALSYIALMAAHPSHVGEPIIGAITLSGIVHGAAFMTQPVLLYGFWVLTRQMEERPLAAIAFSFYALSASLSLMAGSMSGLVIPAILDAGHVSGGHGAPIDPEMLRQTLQAQANYTVILNRAFATAHFVMFAVAMVLWALAWPGRTLLVIAARVIGAVIGLGVIAWALSGTMTLEAGHGALLVTFVQMLWTFFAAAALLRIKTT